MNYFDKLSLYIAKKIGKNDDEDDIEVYAYSTHILLSEICFNLICIPISLLLGVFKYYAVTLIIFYALRRFVGGYHCGKELQCMFTSIITFFIVILFSIVSKDYYILIFILALVTYTAIFPQIPVLDKEHTYDRGSEFNQKIKYVCFRNMFIIEGINLIFILLTYLNVCDLSWMVSTINNSIFAIMFLGTVLAKYIFTHLFGEKHE